MEIKIEAKQTLRKLKEIIISTQNSWLNYKSCQE